MPSLMIRVISAAVAATILFSTYSWMGTKGLIYLSLIVLTLAISEYSRIVFHKFPPLFLGRLSLIATGLLAITAFARLGTYRHGGPLSLSF